MFGCVIKLKWKLWLFGSDVDGTGDILKWSYRWNSVNLVNWARRGKYPGVCVCVRVCVISRLNNVKEDCV